MTFGEQRESEIAIDTYTAIVSAIVKLTLLLILLLILEYQKKNGNSCGIPLILWLEVFFFIILISGLFELNLIWITRCCHRYRIHYFLIQGGILAILVTSWLIYGFIIYFSDDNDCQKNNDTCFWLVIMCIILFFGIFYILAVCCLICCGPFIYCYIRNLMEQQQGPTHISGGQIDTVVQGLSRTTYDPQRFNYESSCKICMVDYDETDEITQLKCDPRHYFHSECIIRWIQEGHNDCPFCRQPIEDIDKLREMMEGGEMEDLVHRS